MKKIILLLFVLFLSPRLFAQSGYSIYYHYEATTERNQHIVLGLRLVLNDSMSYSYLITDEDRYKKNKRFGRHPFPHDCIYELSVGRPFFYANLNGNAVMRDAAIKYNWVLSDSNKTILNYNCKKAICITSKGDTITAFYTPEIKGAFGPDHYYGLPGVILQVFDTRFTTSYIAEKISKTDAEIVYSKKAVWIRPTE